VEVAENNKPVLDKLEKVVKKTHILGIAGQTACFYQRSYKLQKAKAVKNFTHEPGLYSFTVDGLELNVLAVHLKSKTKKTKS